MGRAGAGRVLRWPCHPGAQFAGTGECRATKGLTLGLVPAQVDGEPGTGNRANPYQGRGDGASVEERVGISFAQHIFDEVCTSLRVEDTIGRPQADSIGPETTSEGSCLASNRRRDAADLQVPGTPDLHDGPSPATRCGRSFLAFNFQVQVVQHARRVGAPVGAPVLGVGRDVAHEAATCLLQGRGQVPGADIR